MRNVNNSRRKFIFTASLLSGLMVCLPLSASNAVANGAEPFLGNANAPVTIIEYGSLTCGHCAHFSNTVFPKIKANYINTGKVKFIFRPLPTPPANLSAGMQVIADCEGGSKRFKLIETYFAHQNDIFKNARANGGVLEYLITLANKTTGISKTKINACLQDQSKIEAITASEKSAQKLGIDSTPTLVINGKILKVSETTELDYKAVSTGINQALAAKHKK